MTETTTPKRSTLKDILLSSIVTLGLVMAVTPSASADAAPSGAAATVQSAVDRTMSALDDADISSDEAESILELVDLERVAQFSLGNHWADLTEDQQSRYLTAFHAYANNQLRMHLAGLSKAQVQMGDVASRGSDDAIVKTTVDTNGDRQTVSWRVMDHGSWKVVDIEVQNVWFAIEQRAQFDAILDKNGGDIEALISEISA